MPYILTVIQFFHHQVPHGLNVHTHKVTKIVVHSLLPTLVRVNVNAKALLKFHQSETQSPNNYKTLAMGIEYILLSQHAPCYETNMATM